METSILSVVDLDMKVGASKKGPWTLCTLTGSDKEKYKTFDESVINVLKTALASKSALSVTYKPEPRSYVDRNGQKRESVERVIQSVSAAPTQTPAQAPAAAKQAPKADKMPPEYWEKKDRLEFQRMAHMSALKASADLMAACINAKVESYKFQDAIKLVKVEAEKLYSSFFKAYEGGANDGPAETFDDAANG